MGSMPRKGMRSVLFSTSRPPSSSPSYASSSASSSQTNPPFSFSSYVMVENIDFVESIIRKWNIDGETYTTIVASLFRDNPAEAKEFLKAVNCLQSTMHFFISEGSSSSCGMMVRAQSLMQIAMKRLEKEFYLLLSANRNSLDPESVSGRSSARSSTRSSSASEFEDNDDIQVAGSGSSSVSETAMADLKSIADCMISAGYGKECSKIYKIVRKSIVDETLYYLGVKKLSSSAQIKKMEWEVIEAKIKCWLNAVRVAVKNLFSREKILCDYVFSESDNIREYCFAEISKEAALMLFEFPKSVAAKCRKTPEKMFRMLDLYEAISDLWPEIESIFSVDSTSPVKCQAVTSLLKLGDAVRAVLADLESAIQKEKDNYNSKQSPVVPGGGIHPLSRYVMNYIIFLADYTGSLTDILADCPLPVRSPLPETCLLSPIPGEAPASVVSERLAWIVLVLLCKLDVKAELYNDVALSYLFLANNLNYIVWKVRTSSLKLLFGEEWLINHGKKAKQYAANYERMGWSKVLTSLPDNPRAQISPEMAKQHFKNFNLTFEDTYGKQVTWVIPDPTFRDEIKISLAKKLVLAYRGFYEKYWGMVRQEIGVESLAKYHPDDLGNYLSDLFYGTGASEGGSVSGASFSSRSSPSSTSSSRRGR